MAKKSKGSTQDEVIRLIEIGASVLYIIDFLTTRKIPEYLSSALGNGVGAELAEGIFVFALIGVILLGAWTALFRVGRSIQAGRFRALVRTQKPDEAPTKESRFTSPTMGFWRQAVMRGFIGVFFLYMAYALYPITQTVSSVGTWGPVIIFLFAGIWVLSITTVGSVLAVIRPNWIPKKTPKAAVMHMSTLSPSESSEKKDSEREIKDRPAHETSSNQSQLRMMEVVRCIHCGDSWIASINP